MSLILISYEGGEQSIEKPQTLYMLKQHGRDIYDIPDDAVVSLRHFPCAASRESHELTAASYRAVDDCTRIDFSLITDIPDTTTSPQPWSAPIVFAIKDDNYRIFTFIAKPYSTIGQVWKEYPSKDKLWRNGYPVFNGVRLAADQTLEHCGIKKNDVIEMKQYMAGPKQAIYLLSPCPLDEISLLLTLSHEWEFAYSFPEAYVVEYPDERTSTGSWALSCSAEGHLTDEPYSGPQVGTHLFWEATPRFVDSPLDQNPSPQGVEVFNPTAPSLTPDNSDVILASNFIPAIDKILEGLCLTPAMRTQFIVTWLKCFKDIEEYAEYIAFRFVDMAAYSKVAKLEVLGQPDCGNGVSYTDSVPAARILLLFGGVPKDATEWDACVDATKDDCDDYAPEGWTAQSRLVAEIDWPARIGLDMGAMQDETKLRVLECGAMEVSICALDQGSDESDASHDGGSDHDNVAIQQGEDDSVMDTHDDSADPGNDTVHNDEDDLITDAPDDDSDHGNDTVVQYENNEMMVDAQSERELSLCYA